MDKRGLGKLLSILFPEDRECMLCGRAYMMQPFRPLKIDDLCHRCLNQLSFIREPFCLICGRPTFQKAFQCRDCIRRKETYFAYNRSAVQYNPIMRHWIATYKYRGREHLVEGLVQLLYLVYKQHFQHIPLHAITFIPLYEERLHERRFNQAEQLAVGLSKLTGIPVYSTLIRMRDTYKQSHRGRGERLNSLYGAFSYHDADHHDVGESILLIDDIYTTGSTINEAARILKLHGWNIVYACTIARA